MSSMFDQVFNPSLIFNTIYHNVARLINRRIVRSAPRTMPINSTIREEHFPLLEKPSQLFFETQKLQAPRYILLSDIQTKDMKNYIIGFSDGSKILRHPVSI